METMQPIFTAEIISKKACPLLFDEEIRLF
jgi:hypothetical protein